MSTSKSLKNSKYIDFKSNFTEFSEILFITRIFLIDILLLYEYIISEL